MLGALLNDELETFYELLAQRQTLIDELAGSKKDAPLKDREIELLQNLNDQYERLLNELNQRAETALTSLQEVNRLKEANQSYQSTSHTRRKILNPNLSG